MTLRLKDWLAANVTKDPRALDWIRDKAGEERIARAYRELLSGYGVDTSTILKTTRDVKGQHHGVVAVHGINFYSLCAHHFLPFFGTMDIVYQPGAKIIGLGKFPRLVRAYARRFQIQEDLVKDIADEIMNSGGARGVLVRSQARHLCICSRGPNDPTAVTLTSYVAGDVGLVNSHSLLREHL